MLSVIRSALKGGVEAAFCLSGGTTLARILMRSRDLVLAYHNIIPDDRAPGGDGSLHLPRRSFATQLGQLQRVCEIVPLDTILAGPGAGGRPRVAITFDDAYRGAVTIGVEELAQRGLPGTIFVTPALLGGKSFWWDGIGEPGGGPGLPAEFRELALSRYRGEDHRIREYAAEHGMVKSEVASELVSATEEELQAAATVPGITLGSHSWSHPNLTMLSHDELVFELVEPLEWLRKRFDSVLPWLSYPYGRSTAAVEEATKAAGYAAALRISGGWLPAGRQSRFALPRLNIPAGLSAHGFALRTAGLFTGREMTS